MHLDGLFGLEALRIGKYGVVVRVKDISQFLAAEVQAEGSLPGLESSIVVFLGNGKNFKERGPGVGVCSL